MRAATTNNDQPWSTTAYSESTAHKIRNSATCWFHTRQGKREPDIKLSRSLFRTKIKTKNASHRQYLLQHFVSKDSTQSIILQLFQLNTASQPSIFPFCVTPTGGERPASVTRLRPSEVPKNKDVYYFQPQEILSGPSFHEGHTNRERKKRTRTKHR